MGAVCPSWNFRCYLWHHGREESSRAGIKGRLSVVTRFSTPGEFLVGLWAVSFISPQRTLGSSTRGQKGRQVTYLGPPGHQSHTHHDISVRRTADMNFLFLSVNHNQRLQTGPPNEHSISPPTQCPLKLSPDKPQKKKWTRERKDKSVMQHTGLPHGLSCLPRGLRWAI